MEHRLGTILGEPTDYKLCNECKRINWYENQECIECSNTEFNENKRDVAKQVDGLIDNYYTEGYNKVEEMETEV